MYETARHFEQIAARFSPLVLTGLGVTAVLAGLFVWLGGLGAKRALAAVVGVVSGGVCGFFLIGRDIAAAGISALLVGFNAVIFERIFFTILAAAIAAVFGFAVLAGPYLEQTPSENPINKGAIRTGTQTMSTGETLETTKAYMADFGSEIKRACLQMPASRWVIITVPAVIFMYMGSFFSRLISSLCCAVVGTILVFAGMISLLLYKGSGPISCIANRQPFYAAVFLAMTAFGTIEQLLLCPRIGKKLMRKKQLNKTDEQQLDEQTPDWRRA